MKRRCSALLAPLAVVLVLILGEGAYSAGRRASAPVQQSVAEWCSVGELDQQPLRRCLLRRAARLGRRCARHDPAHRGWRSHLAGPGQQHQRGSHGRGLRRQEPGWAVGGSGTIVHTVNGGATWTAEPGGTRQQLNGVAFAGAQLGWAAGAAGTIVQTANGGATWKAQSSGTYADLNSVAFADGLHGWAVGTNGTIAHTNDGGATWKEQSSGTYMDLNTVAFADVHHGWAVGFSDDSKQGFPSGPILRTMDGGSTWKSQSTGTYVGPFGVAVIDGRHAWVVGSTIVHTTDGGAVWMSTTSGLNWMSEVNGLSNWLMAAAFVDDRHGWAVGRNGTILHTADGGEPGRCRRLSTCS